MKNLILEDEMKRLVQISIAEPRFDPGSAISKAILYFIEVVLHSASRCGPAFSVLRSQTMAVEELDSLEILDSDPRPISNLF